MTTDQKLDELETLLLDSLLEKARQKEPLATVEITLISKWLLSRRSPKKAPESPQEPLIFKGQPLPFLMERLSLQDTLDTLEEI